MVSSLIKVIPGPSFSFLAAAPQVSSVSYPWLDRENWPSELPPSQILANASPLVLDVIAAILGRRADPTVS